MFEVYELELLSRSLSILMANYDEHDLEELRYSSEELESETAQLIKKVNLLSVTFYRDKV
jgi:hypothetical protein